MRKINTLIVGAGVSGLTVAKFVKDRYILIESSNYAGGNSRSYRYGNYIFDIGGHYLHGDIEFLNHVGVNLDKFTLHHRIAKVLVEGKFYDYPIQGNFIPKENSVLPEREVIKGSMRENFVSQFGELAWKFFIPYNEKLFRRSTNSMVPSYYSNMRNPQGKGYNQQFLYANTGRGSQELVEELLKGISVQYDRRLIKLDLTDHVAIVTSSSGHSEKIRYQRVVYTGSLYSLLPMVSHQIPSSALLSLDSVNVAVINAGVTNLAPDLREVNWLYLPDKVCPFFRVGFYNRVMRQSQSEELIYLELSYRDSYEFKMLSNESIKNCLIDFGVLTSKGCVNFSHTVTVENAYPVITNEKFSTKMEIYKNSLKAHDVYLTGRYALWKWTGMMESMKDAYELARLF